MADPDYKMEDINFAAALQRFIAGGGPMSSADTTNLYEVSLSVSVLKSGFNENKEAEGSNGTFNFRNPFLMEGQENMSEVEAKLARGLTNVIQDAISEWVSLQQLALAEIRTYIEKGEAAPRYQPEQLNFAPPAEATAEPVTA